ncbi:MAG: hypothetical protein JWN99_1267 [Ilumatobacteraceae bacterium]|nr:hypothetical protein [Ilumatobacteraceae bacterium]
MKTSAEDAIEDEAEGMPTEVTSAPVLVATRSFDLRTVHDRAVAAWPAVAIAVALPLALYLVLRPENFGLTPNALDPMFYFGYATNFDDMLNATGDRHYFVSRWSAYLPGYVANRIAGPYAGRLLWRLVLAVAILASLWGFGRRRGWTMSQRILVGTLVLTMPMFVRAFFTEYVEYLVVALGICLVCMCLRERQTVWSAVTIGVLGGLIAVANPVAISMVGLCMLTCVLVGAGAWRWRAAVGALVGASAIAVVLAGLVLFRWRYGIHNVYQPSIDFIRTYHPAEDPWRSPRLEWLAKFTWLYMVPIVLATALAMRWWRKVEFDRIERAALVLCAIQYGSHWFDQYVRHNLSLELSYYFSYSYPTFVVALVVVVARLAAGVRPSIIALITVGWIGFLLVGVPDWLRLPSGLLFALVAMLVVAGVAALARSVPAAALAALILLIGWTQIGAPGYDPSAYTPINGSPLYDQLYRKEGDLSETIDHEAVWFEDQMDHVPGDATASFVPTGGWAGIIVGVYAPHVVNRLLLVDPSPHLAPVSATEIKLGTRPTVAVYGPPEEVAAMVATFPADLGIGTKVLDETHRGGLGYRLVVYAMPDAASLPFVFGPDVLSIANGHRENGEVTVSADDLAGVVTYGPYATLHPGTYRVTLHYTSSAAPTDVVGAFDIAPAPSAVGSTIPMVGTAGQPGEVSLTFEAVDPGTRWEFRSAWNGTGTLTVDDVTLSNG